MLKHILAAAVTAVVAGAAPAHAVLVERVVMKVSDLAPATASVDGFIDPWLDWTNAGGHNVGVSGAADRVNNGIDFKDPFVDTNWNEVVQVKVSMFSQGSEQAFILFGPGTSKTDFYTPSNVIGGSYSTVSGGGFNYFSVQGHSDIDRHWFINRSYGSCPNDFGYFAVLDRRASGSYVCDWERLSVPLVGDSTRGFLYSLLDQAVDWDNRGSQVGIADVFAVSVYLERQTPPGGEIPLPAAGWLGLAGLGALGWLKARRRPAT